MTPKKKATITSSPHPLRCKVYIIGKVSDLPYEETRLKFLKAEEFLRGLGQEVVNPMRIVNRGTDWNSAMRLCIPALFSCNAIYLLPDWKNSRGGNIEFFNANAMGFTNFNEEVIQHLQIQLSELNPHY